MNIPLNPNCPHDMRGDMGDLSAPTGYDRCAHCGGLTATKTKSNR